MDKRFFLALFLVAIVLVITPIIFPTPKRPAPARGVDSARSATPASANGANAGGAVNANAAAAPAAAPAAAGAAPAPAAAESPAARPDSSAGPALAAAPAETTTVTTPRTVYRFSSLGAAPVSVQLRDFRTLTAGGQKTDRPVELARPGDALLRYRLVMPGDTVALDRVPFRLERGAAANGGEVLTYEAALANARVAITYTFAPDSYVVRVRGAVQDAPARSFVLVDLPSGIRSGEADTLDDQRHLAFALKPQTQNAKSIGFGKLEPGEERLENGPLTWAAAKNKYFLVGLLTPQGDAPFAELHVVGGPRTSKVPSNARATAVEALRDGTFAFEIYAGPQEWRRLHALGRDFENANPYGGWLQGVVQPFATIVMRVLLWMRTTLGLSYGWVLVIFGVAVRLALWPLNQSAMRTSLKMQRLQPQLQEIQKRHQNDPQKLQAEMMRVYKEHGMSPFSAFAGCLPMLIPMPVLFALFFVFQNTIEFRGVPFLWLHDISLHDPYYALPVLMGVSMFLLSWIGIRNSPPNPQAKMMMYVFPVMMTIFLVKLAAGLNLYYAVQNVAALPQQWLIANERAKAGVGTGSSAPAKTAARPKPAASRQT